MNNRPTIEAWAARYAYDDYRRVTKFGVACTEGKMTLMLVRRDVGYTRETFWRTEVLDFRYMRTMRDDWRLYVARMIRRMREYQRRDIKAATAPTPPEASAE